MPMKECKICGALKSWQKSDPEPPCGKCHDKPVKKETKNPLEKEGAGNFGDTGYSTKASMTVEGNVKNDDKSSTTTKRS